MGREEHGGEVDREPGVDEPVEPLDEVAERGADDVRPDGRGGASARCRRGCGERAWRNLAGAGGIRSVGSLTFTLTRMGRLAPRSRRSLALAGSTHRRALLDRLVEANQPDTGRTCRFDVQVRGCRARARSRQGGTYVGHQPRPHQLVQPDDGGTAVLDDDRAPHARAGRRHLDQHRPRRQLDGDRAAGGEVDGDRPSCHPRTAARAPRPSRPCRWSAAPCPWHEDRARARSPGSRR